LLGEGSVYAWTWIAITTSAAIGVLGAVLDRYGWRQPRVVSLLHYFYVVNLAGLLGIWDEWRGMRHVTWDHIRKADS
jgi:hypothetical protein